MLNFITNVLNTCNAVIPYSGYVVLTAAAVGTTTLTYFVSKYAIKKLKEFGNWFKETTFVINIRALTCRKCSEIHRGHINKVAARLIEGIAVSGESNI